MASEIRVNKINSSSGVGTITLSPTGVDISGITTVSTLKVGTGVTASEDGDIFFTGVCTATTFAGAHSGSGANLTSLPAAQLTGALPAISGANLTGVAATDNIISNTLEVVGVSTFASDVLIGTAVTISESGIAAAGIGITVANINGGQVGGRRNMVMNGAMQVAQRGTSSTSNGYQTIDRWDCAASGMDQLAFTQKQVTDSPDGHYYSFEIDITTAETAQAGDEYMRVQHIIEAQDLQHLAYGTSSAKTTTLSFWVKAKQTGTYAVNFYSSDGSRHISRTYTISAEATWEHKTVTIPGDTSGIINNDNGSGIHLAFILIADSAYVSTDSTSWGSYSDAGYAYGHNVNVGSSSDNYWKITGVQWEVGTEGTSYEHRSFGEELQLCKRYYEVLVSGTGIAWGGICAMYTATETHHQCTWVEKRATPTLTYTTGTNYYRYYGNGTNVTATRPNALLYASTRSGGIQTNSTYLSGSLLQGGAAFAYSQSASTHVAVDAELS